MIDFIGQFPQIHQRLLYLKNIITGIKVSYIIHHRLKLQDLGHIILMRKFFILKRWERFHPFNFGGGNLSGWELLGWEPFWVGTFPGFGSHTVLHLYKVSEHHLKFIF